MWLSLQTLGPYALLLTSSFVFAHHDIVKRQDVIVDPAGKQYAPLPPAVRETQVGPEGYAVEHLGGGLYAVTDGSHQSMVLASDDGVIVVDYPEAMGPRLQYAVGNITSARIKTFIYSHGHADHVAGAGLLADKDVEFIGHEETAAYLRHASDPNRPIPDKTFHDKKTVKVGNQTLELSYKGANHQTGNIFIYAPAQKVLMLVDVVIPGWVPFYELSISENVYGFIESHEQILEYDFEHFLGGHLTRAGTREDVQAQKDYVRDLYYACRDAAFGGAVDVRPYIGAVLAKNPGNAFAAAYTNYAVQAEACYNATTPNWLGRLGGADIFGYGHAFRMVLSFSADFGRTGAVPKGIEPREEESS